MKKIKRVKIKFKNLFLVLIILFILSFIGYKIMTKKINNIYINGNDLLSEQEVLELIDFTEYLEYYKIKPKKIAKRLKTSSLIEEANISKSLFAITIDIKEYKTLWYQESDNKVMLSSKEIVKLEEKILGIPTLINEIDYRYKDKFIEALTKIDSIVLHQISEITYDPSDIDPERFLLYMNDQNYVYINISRMEYLNKYDELLPKLENKKGILYLDSGNHFEIKNNK